MAYTVDWISKVISVPTADLTLVTGTRYSLTMSDFLAEIRRLEWEFAEGLWALPILDHTNTKVDFAGVDYAPFDDLLNGYTVQFTGVVTRVDLLGSNNNIVDVLVVTGVSVVPSNSAGLQIVNTGGGVGTPAEVQAAVWSALQADYKDVDTMGYVIDLLRITAENEISRSGDIITIWVGAVGGTAWRQYDLANGGRQVV